MLNGSALPALIKTALLLKSNYNTEGAMSADMETSQICRPCYCCSSEQKPLKSGCHSKFRSMWFLPHLYVQPSNTAVSVRWCDYAAFTRARSHIFAAMLMDDRPAISATSRIYTIRLMIKTSQLIKRLHHCSSSSFHPWPQEVKKPFCAQLNISP